MRAKPVCTSSAMKTTPFAFAHSCSAGRNPGAGTMKPPSPWMGSMMIAARRSAPIWRSIMWMARSAASAPLSPSRNGYDMGTR